MHERRVTAEEVNPELHCSAIKRGADKSALFRKCCRNEGNRCDGNALVDDGNPIFPRERIRRRDKFFRLAANKIIDSLCRLLCRCADTGKERNTHGNRTDIKVLLFDHFNCFDNVKFAEHSTLLYIVHCIENICML